MHCNICIHNCWPHNPTTFPYFPFYPSYFFFSPGLLVSRSWMAGGMAWAFPFQVLFESALMCPYCGMRWSCACIPSSSAVCFSVLEFQSLYSTLWKRRKNGRTSHLLAWSAESAILLFTFYHSHWDTCRCFSFAVTYHSFTTFTRRQRVNFVP